MCKAYSKVCGEILGITPEAYRQRLSRIRQKMAGFLKQYCGLSSTRMCSCQKRVGYAIKNHRLNPADLEYLQLEKADEAITKEYMQAMEEMDAQSLIFAELPKYRSPQVITDFLQHILHSGQMNVIQET